MKEWLENIKQGDEVIIAGRDSRRIAKVSRTTQTLIIADGSRFNKSYGQQVGVDDFYSSSIHEATPEIKARTLEQMKRRKIVTRLESIRWKDVSTEILEKIAELIKT
jgi:hypothetical protein